MTITEAIEWFSDNFPDYVCELGPSDKQMAYNMAIKALEQMQLNQ